MSCHRIRAHNEQLSEFERGRIIGLKEGVFSDESCFQLCPDDHRRRVWRQLEQRADPAFPIASHTGPQQGVLVWGAISFEAGLLWSSLEAHLQHIAYQTLPWPTRSPYSSPIEHVWDMMGRRLHLQGNVDYLARQLEKIWQEIPQETIRVLYHSSISRRVVACIQDRGRSSPY
ncbi:transposable element Tc1 transposase [Trichonephila clavipes]|nr:transposable element Tc1 transposase [Trichonephila clavipes]